MAAKPARVLSAINLCSICARLAITWKKKRPAGVFLSMPLVRLLEWTCRCSRSATSSMRPLTLRPSRSSFQTANVVSPIHRCERTLSSPGRVVRVPLILSINTRSQPAFFSASGRHCIHWTIQCYPHRLNTVNLN